MYDSGNFLHILRMKNSAKPNSAIEAVVKVHRTCILKGRCPGSITHVKLWIKNETKLHPTYRGQGDSEILWVTSVSYGRILQESNEKKRHRKRSGKVRQVLQRVEENPLLEHIVTDMLCSLVPA